jgi:putative ABC transport system permease protein
MAIPIKYNLGNLLNRKISTVLTILGIGALIAVMVSMLALYNGVHSAIVSSGSKENLMILREGSLTEFTSWVPKDTFRVIRAIPGIQHDAAGEPLVSPELVIVFKLPKKDNPKGSNVNVRGVTSAAFALRPHVTIVEGRMFRPGSNEAVVSRRVRDRFVNVNVGQGFRFGTREWKVVGVFDAKGTAFDSEIWADLNYLGLAQKRDEYSSILVRPVDSAAFRAIANTIRNENRLRELQVKTELKYYEEQTQGLLGIIILVSFVTIFMVLGAMLGAMNTMLSAVATRTREIATMRALGFKRRAILFSIVIEAGLISFLGGVVGVLLALPINGLSTGTTNFQTFSEVAFSFRISPVVAIFGLFLATFAGIIGGLFPAIGAARLPIARALRET